MGIWGLGHCAAIGLLPAGGEFVLSMYIHTACTSCLLQLGVGTRFDARMLGTAVAGSKPAKSFRLGSQRCVELATTRTRQLDCEQ